MKMKYGIGFFAGVFFVFALLGIGYRISSEYVLDREESKVELVRQKTESITTKGDATKNEGYYICGLHGYVVVYLNDKKTIFEVTNIPLTDLPKELSKEIKDGKYVETEEDLYGFLENYSS